MKRFIAIATIILVSVISYGKTKEQVEMEKTLSSYVTITATNGFKVFKTITLADEIKDEIAFQTWNLNWQKSFYKEFQSLPGKHYQDLAEDSRIKALQFEKTIKYLEAVEYTYPELYNKVSFTIYKLAYWYKDADGNEKCNQCYGKFNVRDEMVAFRVTGSSDWIVIGELCSIPGYKR